MLREFTGLFADDDASMLADLAQLTPEPAALGSLLAQLGYKPEPFGSGLYAPGADGQLTPPVILFPLYARAGLAVRKRELVGRHVSRSGTIAAGLAALRSIEQRPPLLFLLERQAPPDPFLPSQVISLEGGVVPRIWRHCFGSFDVLVRIASQRPHPGLSNTGVNALEASIPILQALLHLKADLQLRLPQRGHFADAPLQPRLTINAMHGGLRGSVLPTVFDILLNRRYDPAENVDTALEEVRSTVAAGASRSLRIELTMTEHNCPVPDPDASVRSRTERALAAGWGWPQVPFCSSSTLIPGAMVLGGLERPDFATEAENASTTLDEMAALARTLRVLLSER